MIKIECKGTQQGQHDMRDSIKVSAIASLFVGNNEISECAFIRWIPIYLLFNIGNSMQYFSGAVDANSIEQCDNWCMIWHMCIDYFERLGI